MLTLAALASALTACPPTSPLAPAPSVAAAPPAAGARGGAHARALARLSGRVAIVTESPDAADLALRALALGGTAADAAIAGLLGAGVAQPVSSGLGGGGIGLYWDAARREASVLDFLETAPRLLRPWDLPRRHAPEERRGLEVGVPGELAGLAAMQARWGRLPLSEPLRAAATLAERGFVVGHHLRRSMRWSERWLLGDPGLGPVLAPGGRPLELAARARNPALAATLRRLAAEGPAAFYEGALARDVVATAQAAGGQLSLGDLRGYRVVERRPLEASYEGRRVLTLPPPSAGGVLVLQALGMHDAASLRALGLGSGSYQHVLAETFRGSIADRIRALADPDHVEVDTDALLDRARLAARRAAIDPNATRRAPKIGVDDKGTTHIVVVDADGNVASVTSSVRDMFGARLVTAGGFPLNDQVASFTPGDVGKQFGVSRAPNRPRRGARPLTPAAATLVLSGDEPLVALGASGGGHIGTAVAQALFAHLVFDRPVGDCVSAPRVRTPVGGGVLLEPAEDEALVLDLRRRGELVRQAPDYSALSMVIWRRGGEPRLEAAADPRKGGVALTP